MVEHTDANILVKALKLASEGSKRLILFSLAKMSQLQESAKAAEEAGKASSVGGVRNSSSFGPHTRITAAQQRRLLVSTALHIAKTRNNAEYLLPVLAALNKAQVLEWLPQLLQDQCREVF